KLIVVSRRNRAAIRTFRLSPWRTAQFLLHPINPNVDLSFGLAPGLGEGGEETFAVRVVAEDFLATIPAIDDGDRSHRHIRGAVGEA
ncbi:MAG: hypothetical protein ABI651_11330, partial [Verrucomicrobiota bacterium]